ncbi:hypothetical protein LTR91_025323 [Friedmanniomyces endolithicus]|uniref:Cercosporin MFS transporter CTB4 n=1 Tax=Friedmanniomyces endolithicus TaxID=329885 RepID=A0AAN6H0E8_9PEZI|nr:hypothetical protein LTR35_013428 [Friedmanniomyces endolithicus]KAK0280514.1 hypothetical protein LTS00_012943 [Friedmanniomyces endolithicus]KAK0950921.1 hypothetical protein LTR91_025323 [Friedmanniomyces endolithicus]KAK1012576.1 hypothetical protein LTR54_004503 [Friedmanniomyces endolithicus]KAK1052183.1 hypothetical protein LTS16_001862 [Friedmanniomyces endolithicus]
MAAHKVPAFLGGDLPEKEQLALQEGHDADIPSNQGVETDAEAAANRNEFNSGLDKDKEPSSPSSIDEPISDLEKGQPTTTAEEQEPVDPNIVDWSGPDDPENPMNFTATVKWGNIAVLSAMTFLTPLASSMFAPGVPELLKDFGTNNQAVATFVVSVYLLGFAAGPIVIAPLSELYGRLMIYHVCNVGFIVFTVACALATDMNMLIAFRFLAGAWGISPITNGGGTIADLMPAEKRGGAMAIWAIGPLLGPVIGPVCGGFLAEAKGWRWIFWVIAIATGAVTIAGFLFMRETYAPVILERRAKRLRKETGNPDLRSKLAIDLPPKTLFLRAIVRPTKLLFLSPICALMSLYMAVVYGILYLLFTTFTFVFEENYHFSGSTVGLVYIGCGVGNLLGLAIIGKASDPIMKHLAKKYSDGKIKPEYRLPVLMYAGPFIPVGLFIYGWTAQYHVQWAVPILGTLFVGIGLIAAFMAINTYLVDTFGRYAASAMAANTILRSILGAVFPLFALQMYAKLGLGWGNSLIAFVALALCPIPFLFYRYGEKLRTHPKWQVNFGIAAAFLWIAGRNLCSEGQDGGIPKAASLSTHPQSPAYYLGLELSCLQLGVAFFRAADAKPWYPSVLPLQTEGTCFKRSTSTSLHVFHALRFDKTDSLLSSITPSDIGNINHNATTSTMSIRGELARILGGDPLSKDAYEGLVRLLANQQAEIGTLHRAPTGSAHDIRAMEQKLHDRGAEIKRLTDHVHELKTFLSERDEMMSLRNHQIRGYRKAVDELTAELVSEHATRKKGTGTSRKRFNDGLDVHETRGKVDGGRLFEKQIKDLQLQNAKLVEAQEEQDTALLLATAFQKEAHNQRQHLGAQLRERDERILAPHEQTTTLQEQIYQFTNATSWDEATASALRAQATTHLKLVKGLQADLVERDARIEKLNDAKLAFMRNMEERQETLILAHKKVVKERKDAEARVMDGKIALSNASIKMGEWKKMAETQKDLIGKLMAANQSG